MNMRHTGGKGPYADRLIPVNERKPHWIPPPTELNRAVINRLLEFTSRRCDGGVFCLFRDLANTPPAARLARNLAIIARRLVSDPATTDAFTVVSGVELESILQLEQYGAPVEVLGAAYELFNMRDRQNFIVSFGCKFSEAAADDFGWLKDDTNR